MKKFCVYITLSILALTTSLSAVSRLDWPYIGVPTRVAKVMKQSKKQRVSPLALAASQKDYFSIKYLLDHGVDIHSRGPRSKSYKNPTALEVAIKDRNIFLVNYLLERGAKE